VPPVIGIVGGGQLARMMLAPAAKLALPVTLLADPHDPAVPFCRSVVPGVPDAEGLARLADVCDVLTVEHELVDLDTLAALEQAGHLVRPSSSALAVAVDKARQRDLLAPLGIPLAPFTVTDQTDEVEVFAQEHGWPLVLKPPRGGYDGRGVYVAHDRAQAAEVLASVGGEVLVEPLLTLDTELAVLVARRPGGASVTYTPVETRQIDGMCREVLLPAPSATELHDEAMTLAARVAEAIGSVGILSVEMFVSDGRLLLNELAARPHNAGHPTIEGAVTSQFENHLRAVADLPLGDPRPRSPTAMVNVVGGADDPRDHLAAALEHRDVAVHLYGKEHRPGRKLGHVSACAPDLTSALERARAAAAALDGGDRP
jgi:5-(carboxyamino)imidazole ribonucleotide synthase